MNVAGAAIFGLGVVFGRRLGAVGRVVSCGVGVAFVTDFAFQMFGHTRWRHVLVGVGTALVVGGKESVVVGIAMVVLDFVGSQLEIRWRPVSSILQVGFNLVAVEGVRRGLRNQLQK